MRSVVQPDPAVMDLVTQVRGPVYAAAEGFAHDLHLDVLDHQYQRLGLRRYRRVWLASLKGCSTPVGAVVAYRGPLGFNFSFLENRCDLLMRPGLAPVDEEAVLLHLLQAASSVYDDFQPGYIPVVVDATYAPTLMAHGARQIRTYAQSIWLRAGFHAWYDHVEALYARVRASKKMQRLGLAVPRLNPEPSSRPVTAGDMSIRTPALQAADDHDVL